MSDQHSGSGGFPISAWAIRNPVPVALLFIGLIIAGLIAYSGLAVKQFPNIQFPVVAVTVTQSGAAPGEMETQITRPVEDAISGITGVNNIQSVVTQGVSTTSIQFEMGEDLQKTTDEVRAKIDTTRQVGTGEVPVVVLGILHRPRCPVAVFGGKPLEPQLAGLHHVRIA